MAGLCVPDPYLPVVAAARLDCRATIGNIYGLVGIDPSAVPDIGVILSQRLGRACYADFIRRLPGAAP